MAFRSEIFLVLLLSISVAYADDFEQRRITAYGTATIQVAPDQMIWRLKIRNVNPTSGGAVAKDHGPLVQAVLEYLTQNHIADQTIQTSGMRLGVDWEHDYSKRVRAGYFASTEVSFILSDIEQYSSIWLGLSSLPAVTVLGVDMNHTERIRFQNEARIKAVLAAREKAEAMAAALGIRIGAPLAIDEDLTASTKSRGAFPGISNTVVPVGEPAEVGEYVAPGYIPIVVRVMGVFEILSEK